MVGLDPSPLLLAMATPPNVASWPQWDCDPQIEDALWGAFKIKYPLGRNCPRGSVSLPLSSQQVLLPSETSKETRRSFREPNVQGNVLIFLYAQQDINFLKGCTERRAWDSSRSQKNEVLQTCGFLRIRQLRPLSNTSCQRLRYTKYHLLSNAMQMRGCCPGLGIIQRGREHLG